MAQRGRDTLLSGAMGALLLRPWYDRLSVAVLGNWYFPVSRIWAAALEARGSVEHLAQAVPTTSPASYLAKRVVGEIDRLRREHASAHDRWEGNYHLNVVKCLTKPHI